MCNPVVEHLTDVEQVYKDVEFGEQNGGALENVFGGAGSVFEDVVNMDFDFDVAVRGPSHCESGHALVDGAVHSPEQL